jgi:hypothetical protein
MPMFKKNLKLIATAIGLVTVLVMGLAMPGATQQSFQPPCPLGPCVDRFLLVQALQNAFAGLTASTEDLLDFERAVFWSDGVPRQIAYIPPDPASGLWDRVQQLRAGETVEVPFGGLYVAQGKSLLGQPPLAFKMRLRGNKDHAEIVFINAEGEEVIAVPATLDLKNDPIQSCGGGGTSRPKFSVEVLDYGECPFARSRSNDTAPLGGKACFTIKICCLGEGSAHFEWN